ncbi:hypothetical protein GPL17_35915 [Bradyrhizobium yuanmingense]|uniref:hypothetical protein n=1 Tax=Bradyrhizobium yuanmingense TaxID=108015 RepID=UPI0012F8940A|nr:hypothetical protein [Bradyrhizobium yuanmingense]MDF0522200.1 hypothetical protein [Bradyrhizobium yuanmingense]MVT55787.1 hypothetical protein [Bradyrhizobium yuanmingense]
MAVDAVTCHWIFIQRQLESRGFVKRSPKLGQPELEFSGFKDKDQSMKRSRFSEEMGYSVPIA